MGMGDQDLERRVKEVGPWYHRIDLGNGVFTKAEGFSPQSKWRVLAQHLPEDLTGKTVLEVGCSSAYYSVRMAQRGATCYAFDHFQSAVNQANFLADHFGVEIDASVASVYDVERFNVRHYDYVLHLGVLYHLRYPMLALDQLGDLDFDTMFMQTITYDRETPGKEYADYLADQHDPAFAQDDFPTLKFVEHKIRSDATSWFNFNNSAVESMMRAAGMTDVERIAGEFWMCKKGERPTNGDIEFRDLLRGIRSNGEASDDSHYLELHDKFQALENNVARLSRENALLKEQISGR